MIRTLVLMLALAAASPALAQSAAAPAPAATPAPPPADPKDVSSDQRIVLAVYETISGPAGPRDWNRLRSLMAPGARFIVTSPNPDGGMRTRVLTTEDYIGRAGPLMLKEGFYEHGVIGQGSSFSHISSIASPYESRHAMGEKPFARGINHFELVSDGKRWWIATISWEAESPTNPLPAWADKALLPGLD
ncbi:MAG: hypothetical protein JSR45_07690 [Proteobacteria bacterium]|nr:hypothetical protein [Pseudomonadota bacterium]